MRILLSAYACEPGRGSEPGVGWHWAVEIARLGHEVEVLTRQNNVAAVELGFAKCEGLRLNVHGYDLPRWARWWKKGGRGVRLYYSLWQWGAYRKARMLHRSASFDLVHHITFGVHRQPSFMGRLGIPFVVGPIGGGESAPSALLKSLPIRARITEMLRSAGNLLIALDPLVAATFRRASLIICKTPETLESIPKRFQDKCVRLIEIAVDPTMIRGPQAQGTPTVRFLFAGRLLYWKGVHLAIQAFQVVHRRLPQAKLTVVGDGPDRERLVRLTYALGLREEVEWLGWMPREQLVELYSRHTAFVFPSLHDSSGNVVMEALSQGLPVVCLDLGGPGAILPEGCGFKAAARNRTEQEVIQDLAESMTKIALDVPLRRSLGTNATAAARRQTWDAVVRRAYAEIETRLKA